MIYKIGLTSTSNIGKTYTITIDTDAGSVDCDCKAGRIFGYCKHIRIYKKLIKELMKT